MHREQARSHNGGSARQLQVVPDRQARISLVQGIEVQPRGAAIQQALAHFADHLLAKRLDALRVVAVGFKLLANPAWDFCATAAEDRASLL